MNPLKSKFAWGLGLISGIYGIIARRYFLPDIWDAYLKIFKPESLRFDDFKTFIVHFLIGLVIGVVIISIRGIKNNYA